MKIRASVPKLLIISALVMPAPQARASEEPKLPDVAMTMIAACVKFVGDNQLPPVSVVIVDDSGALTGMIRQSGALGLAAEAALLKARTASRIGIPTGQLATQDPAARDLLTLLQLTQVPGGIPIRQGDRLLGAVGVSGGSPERDASCAQAAVDAGAALLAVPAKTP